MIFLFEGIKAIYEPFHIDKLREYMHVNRPKQRFVSLNEDDKLKVKNYLHDWRYKRMSNYPFTSKQHQWNTDRCVRIPGLVDWLREEFSFEVLYLIRHPISSVLSRIRNGWNINPQSSTLFSEYYQSGYYQENVFNKTIKSLINRKIEENSFFGIEIIRWCLENTKMLNQINYLENFSLITYEELTLESEKMINYLSEQLHLSNIEEMYEIANSPSYSTKYSRTESKEAILNNNRKYLIEKWKDQINKDQEESVAIILEAFGIEIYNSENIYPSAKYTKFI